ncbi:phage tail protein [Brachyspira alvinipulli]|uniref:phage tail protein n=1 Tax=Brachyspira alvinipulli TaxID=84379 RepID=UPI003006C548
MNKKEYVLIDENNVIVEMIKIDDKEKIKKLSIYKESYRIEEKKYYYYKGLNLNRVVNDAVLSNREAIEKGLITLKENEVLINDVIQTIEKTQKIVNNEIVEKTAEEKLSDGLITKEEYNNIQNEKRQILYKNETDNMMLDFMSTYFENHKKEMSESELEIWKTIETKKQAIKEEYPKQN